MAPTSSQDKDKHSLSTDQTKLLCQVMTTGNVTLTPAQWSDVASILGISNGKAAKERFRYLMNQLNGTPTKAARGDATGTPKEPSTPTPKIKATPKKEAAPKTPVSVKNKTAKASPQKRKREEAQQDAEIETPSKKQKAINGTNDETSPTKPSQADGQNIEKTQTQTRTDITLLDFTSNAANQLKDKDGNNGDHNPHLKLDSDAIKFLTSNTSKSLSAGQPVSGTWAGYNSGAQTQFQDSKDDVDVNNTDAKDMKIHDHPFDTYLAEEGFGAIGGGEGSMFPDAGDEVA